jgi:hypothetical protein
MDRLENSAISASNKQGCLLNWRAGAAAEGCKSAPAEFREVEVELLASEQTRFQDA